MSQFESRACLNCTKEFLAEIRYIKRGHAKYCSRACATKHIGQLRIKPLIPNTTCAYCNKEFYKPKSKLSKSGLYFCCREHKDLAQKIGGIKEIMPSHYGTGLCRYRTFAIEHFGPICNRCGYDKNIAAIVVHHKDRDRTNNSISNLEVLCANCHSIEHLSEFVDPDGYDPSSPECKSRILPD